METGPNHPSSIELSIITATASQPSDSPHFATAQERIIRKNCVGVWKKKKKKDYGGVREGWLFGWVALEKENTCVRWKRGNNKSADDSLCADAECNVTKWLD